MKKIILLAASAAVLALLVSCQQQEPDASNAGQELVPVTLSASFDAIDTKVSYEEEDTGSNYLLKPLWEKGADSVIGFDENGNKYTFSVSDVVDGVATLSGDAPASCTLHLIYLCGATAEGITDSGISVSYASQSGDKTMPAVMLADGAVAYGTGNFEFHNAGAVIGVKAVKGVPDGSAVSSITVSGENLSAATIALDGSSLKLTATENADDAISTASLSDVTVTDANGTLSQLVLIAVPAEAVVNNVSVATDNGAFEFTLASPSTLAANQYSYVAGQKFAGKVSVSLVANLPGSASFMIDGEATPSKTVNSGTEITIKAEPASGDYVFVKWSDGDTNQQRTVTVNEDVEYTAVFSYKITAYIPVGYVYGNASSALEYLDVNKATFTAGSAPAETSFVGWMKEGGDGTILSTDATYTTDPSAISSATNFIPVFKSVATSKYVDIVTALNTDKTVKTHTKWAKQNLSITASGEKSWKGGNATAVIVPGTSEPVKNGDYFQWAAYVGYCGEGTAADKGLLIYDSFTSTACGDTEDKFTFKSAGEGKRYRFTETNYDTYIGKSPYYESTAYTAYLGTGEGKAGLSTLDSSDDVASIILGSSWRMPKSAEFQALKNATVWAWDETDKGYYVFANGVDTSKKYNALLFFPAAGYGTNSNFYSVGRYGYCWSSSLSSLDTKGARGLGFSGSSVTPQDIFSRYGGRSVRPVSD